MPEAIQQTRCHGKGKYFTLRWGAWRNSNWLITGRPPASAYRIILPWVRTPSRFCNANDSLAAQSSRLQRSPDGQIGRSPQRDFPLSIHWYSESRLKRHCLPTLVAGILPLRARFQTDIGDRLSNLATSCSVNSGAILDISISPLPQPQKLGRTCEPDDIRRRVESRRAVQNRMSRNFYRVE